MFLFIAVPAIISFALGWWGRGHWEKDRELRARGVIPPHKADGLARTPHHQQPTPEEWERFERQANGEATP